MIEIERTVAVTITAEEIVAGLDTDSLIDLMGMVGKKLGTVPEVRSLEDAILRRHYGDHDTSLYLCSDPVCAAWRDFPRGDAA